MRTLVVYSSKYGATEACAKQIEKVLQGKVELVNLRKEKNVDLKSYDMILLGSPIYAGSMRKEIKKFCKNQEEALKTKRVGVFLSCFDEANVDSYMSKNLPETIQKNIKAKVCCGGRLDFNKMNFFESFIVRRIANSQKPGKEVMPPIKDKKVVDTISRGKIKKFVDTLTDKK